MATLKDIYEALRADKAPVPESYDEFKDYMTSGPNHGYDHRKAFYDALKADGAPIHDSYEDFSRELFASKPAEKGAAGGGGSGNSGNSDNSDKAELQSGWQPNEAQRAAFQQQMAQGEANMERLRQQAEDFSEYSQKAGINFGKTVKGAPQWNPATNKFEDSYLTPAGERTTSKVMADFASQEYRNSADVSINGRLRKAQQRKQDIERKLAERGEKLKAEHEKNKPTGVMGFLKGMAEAGADRMVGKAGDNPEEWVELSQDEEYQSLSLALRTVDKQISQLSNAKDKEDHGERFWHDFFRNTGQAIFNVDAWDFGKHVFRDANAAQQLSGRIDRGEELSDADYQAAEELYLYDNVMKAYGDLGRGARWGDISGNSISFMKDFLLTGGFSGMVTSVPANLSKGVALRAAAKMGADWAGKRLALQFGKEGLFATLRSGGKGAMNQLIKTMGVRGMAQAMTVKAVGVGAEDLLIRAPLMTFTVQGQSTAAKIIDTKLGPVVVDEDTGELRFSNDKDWGEAAWEAGMDQVIENYSEMWGAHLPGLTNMKKALGARNLTTAILRSTRKGAGTILSKTSNFLSRAGVNGYFGEVGEEYYGQLWRTGLGLESASQPKFDKNGNPVYKVDENGEYVLDEKGNPIQERENNFKSGQFHGDIWGGMALSIGLTGGGTMALNYAGLGGAKGVSAANYAYRKHKVNVADRRASELLTPEVWDNARTVIDAADNGTIGDLAEMVMADENINEKQRAAVMDYMEQSMIFRGYNLGEIMRDRAAVEPNPSAGDEDELSDSYMDGYNIGDPQEMNDAKNMLDYQRQHLGKHFTEEDVEWIDRNDPIGMLIYANKEGWDDEAKDAVRDYLNAKMVYEGMMQGVRDGIDEQIAASDAMIEGRINGITGQIHPATMSVDDRKVYIVGGNLSLNGNGTIDKENSDESLIVRDAETGKLDYTAPNAILSVEEALDPTEERAKATETIRQEYARRAADKIDGTLTFNPGDVYTINDGSGEPVIVTLVGPAVDEQGAPIPNVYTVGYPNGMQAQMEADMLQQMADAANLERLNQFEQQRQAERQARRKAEREVARPQYNYGDMFTLDVEGSFVRGSVTAAMNEDGLIEVHTEKPINGNKVNLFTREELDAMLHEQPRSIANVNTDHNPAEEKAEEITNKLLTGGAEDENNSVNLQGDENATADGERFGQDNGVGIGPEGADAGGRMAADSAGGVADNRDRSYIRVYEEGLGTSHYAHTGYSERDRREAESERLIGIAQHNGQYIEKQSLGELGKRFVKPSGESEVYINDEQGRVYKVKNPAAKSPMKGNVRPEDAIYEHLVHNKYFPEAAYGFEGISDDMGDVRIVLSQDYIDSYRNATEDEISAALAEKGLYPEGNYRYGNDEISVTDVMGDNALVGTDGKVYFIDPIIDFKKPVGEILGGNNSDNSDNEDNEDDERELSSLQLIPRDEKGKLIFEQAESPEVGWDALVEKTGGDNEMAKRFADNKVLSKEKALAKAEKEKPKAIDDIDEFIESENQRKAALERAKAELEMWRKIAGVEQLRQDAVRAEQEAEAQRIASERAAQEAAEREAEEQWKRERKSIDRKLRETADEMRDCPEAVEILKNMDPLNVYEVAAMILSGNKIYLNDQAGGFGLKRQLGYGEGEIKKLFGLFARKENGGKSLHRLAEDTFKEACGMYGIPYDNSAAIEALESVIGSAHTMGDIRNYIARNRMEQARDYYNHWLEELERGDEEYHQARYHLSREEYEAYVEQLEAELAQVSEEDLRALDAIIAEDEALRNKRSVELQQSEIYGTEREQQPPVDSGGVEVLPAAQAYRNGRGEEAAGRESAAIGGEGVGQHGAALEGASAFGTGVESQPTEGLEQTSVQANVQAASAEVNTNPTEAQKEAGNYRKGHVKVEGYDITIEQPKGSIRRGPIDPATGKPEWEQEMHNTYGYILGTEDVDGDHIDVFLSDNPEQGDVFVVDQYNEDGSFDEHKVMYGFGSAQEAMDAYLSNYEKGWEKTRRLEVTGVSKDEFKKWIDSSHRKTKPFADYEFIRNKVSASSQGSVAEYKSVAPIDEVNMPTKLQWSNERAGNGEPFLIGEKGSIDLVQIPEDVFDKMGIAPAPFRLTPSMVTHVYERHRKELRLNTPEDAVKAILDVMNNFDHVRQGRENTFIFSIEGTRTGSARRAVTFVLEYDKGEWLGIKTVGYDRIPNLKELTTLWEKGERKSSATGVAPANVTSAQSSQGDRTDGIASNQRVVNSDGKVSTLSSDEQADGVVSSDNSDNSDNSYKSDKTDGRGGDKADAAPLRRLFEVMEEVEGEDGNIALNEPKEEYNANEAGTDFDTRREKAIKDRGTVTPGLAEMEVKVVNVERHPFGSDKPIAQAKAWAKENIVGEHTASKPDGASYNYTISNKAIDKYLSQSATGKSDNLGVHLSALTKLPEIIGESVEVEVHPDYKKDEEGIRRIENGYESDRLVHRLYGAANIGGVKYRVKSTIIETKDEKLRAKAHSYEVTNIELLDESRSSMVEPKVSQNGSDVTLGTAKLLQGVEKSYDKGVKLLEASDKNNKFAHRYETSKGKKVNYISETGAEAYQPSLFDNDFSGDIETSQSGNVRSRPNQVQRKGNPLLRRYNSRLKKKDGEFCLVERTFVESRSFDFTSGNEIKGPEDVAFIFSQLEDESVEHTFAVFVKGGEPTVVELCMGIYASSQVNIPAIKEAYTRLKPDTVYFVHNHPTGNLQYSQPDVNILRVMEKALGKKIEGVIVNLRTGKFGTFTSEGKYDTKEKRTPGKMKPLKVYRFGKQAYADDFDPSTLETMNSAQKVAAFVQSHRLGGREKISILVASRSLKCLANVHTRFISLSNVDKVAEEIVHNINTFGGESAFIYGNLTAADAKLFNKLQEAVKEKTNNQFRLNDAVRVESENGGYRSAFEGDVFEPGEEYGAENYDKRAELKAGIDVGEGRRRNRLAEISIEDSQYCDRPADRVVVSGKDDLAKFLREEGYSEAEISETLREYDTMKASGRKLSGGYDHESKKILIFAENLRDTESALLTLQHEELHHQIDIYPELQNGVERLSESMKKLYGKLWKKIQTYYSDKDESEQHEELVVYSIERAIKRGELAELYGKLAPNEQEYLSELIKSIGYEVEILESGAADICRRARGYTGDGRRGDSNRSASGEPAGEREAGLGGIRFGLNGETGDIWKDHRDGLEEHITNAAIRMDESRQEQTPQQRMADYVRELADKLHLDNVDIVEDASTLKGKRAKAKGFYTRSTGRITIVLSNNQTAEDVERTLLHEAVAHFGLRRMFGKAFNTFLDNVYESATPVVRERIAALAAANGWDFRTATEEYLASLAEDTNFEDARKEAGWWSKVKQLFKEMLSAIGLEGFADKAVKIGDNELRYILWASYENLKGSNDFGGMENAVMQDRLLSEKETQRSDIEQDDLFRDGDFSPRDKAIARDAYNRICESNSFQSREALQDSMLGLRALYQAILGKKTKIEDVAGFENAYLYENRMSSTNKTEQYEYFLKYMKPLINAIGALTGKSSAERDKLTEYMMAKHGLERNEYMRNEAAANGEETERDFAGLCGLTGTGDWNVAEFEARQIVNDYEATHKMALIDKLWEATNDATKASLEKIYLSGILSKDTYEKVRDMYEHYIPLRGWDETTSDEVYGYLTSQDGPLMGNIMKRAHGRSSKADDPIATIGMMADAAIRQGNRNIMKQRFLNFVLNHQSDAVSIKDLWFAYDEVARRWEPQFADVTSNMTAEEVEAEVEKFEAKIKALAQTEPDKYKRGREAADIPYKIVKGNLREHQVLIKRGGRTYVVTINGNPRAAQALNGLTNPDVETNGVIGNMLKAGEWVNRQLSAFYTTRNPDFVVSNFLRDMLYANCMTWVKENPRYALRFHKNFGRVNPIKMRQLLGKWSNNELNMNDAMEKAFYDFMRNGGETGYTSVKDIEGHKKTVSQELKKQGSVGRQAWHALGMQLELLNRSAENCARFAAFLTSRQFGRSIDRAIYDAKEVSVNFNKKGSGGKMVNAIGQNWAGKLGSYLGGLGRAGYVFWNAGIQGMTNFGRNAKNNPLKFIAGAAALFTLGYVIPMLAQMLGGGDGDDDDKNAYYNLPEYIRRSNICFKAGNQWISIPLPIEYRSIYGLGELMYGVVSGNERYSDDELAFHMASQVSQILPLDMLEGGGGVHAFIPSAAKPFTEAYIMNEGWTGMPVYKDTPYNKADPEWAKAYQSADQHLVAFSRWLNEVSGGDDFKKGSIDINPSKIEYLLNGTFGGMFTFPNKVKKSGETAFGDREFEWRNIPIANRVIKSGDERTANRKLQNEYFKYKEEYETTSKLVRKYEDAADDGVMGYAEKVDFLYNSPEYLRYEIFGEFKGEIDSYREEIAVETDETVRKQIEGEMWQVMRELINALHDPEKYFSEDGVNK